MRGTAHLIPGIAAGLPVAIATANPDWVAVSALASLLPDLDHTGNVLAKKVLPVVGEIVSKGFRALSAIARRTTATSYDRRRFSQPGRDPDHRALTHTIGFWLGLCALLALIPGSGVPLALSVLLGALSHLLADACTKAGCPLLWPLMVRGQRWRMIRLAGRLCASGSGWDWIWAALWSAPGVTASLMLG